MIVTNDKKSNPGLLVSEEGTYAETFTLRGIRIRENGDIKYLTRQGTQNIEQEDIRIVRLSAGTHKLGPDYQYSMDPQNRITVAYQGSTMVLNNSSIYQNKVILFTNRNSILPEIISSSKMDEIQRYLKVKKKYTPTEIAVFTEVYQLEVTN